MKLNPPNILVLAAGFGTRLGSLSQKLPKGLITFKGQTLLGRMLTDAYTLPHQNPIAIITNNYHRQYYREWLSHNDIAGRVKLITNGVDSISQSRGAIGDMAFALDHLLWWDQDLLVLPSDTYYNFSLIDLLKLSWQYQTFCTVVRQVSKEVIKNRLGCAVMSGEAIIDFIEKPDFPPSSYAAIPFYYYPKTLLPYIKKYLKTDNNHDAPGSIIPWFITQGLKIHTLKVTSQTLDVGTLEDINTLTTLK